MIGDEFEDYMRKELRSPSDYEVTKEIKRYVDSGWVLLNISSHDTGGDWSRTMFVLHFYKLKEGG